MAFHHQMKMDCYLHVVVGEEKMAMMLELAMLELQKFVPLVLLE